MSPRAPVQEGGPNRVRVEVTHYHVPLAVGRGLAVAHVDEDLSELGLTTIEIRVREAARAVHVDDRCNRDGEGEPRITSPQGRAAVATTGPA